ncbi:MAG TPA: hypothetical protein DEF34_03475 [Desulfotomaculum sp.]|nr:hypothetical protein [Desulfotomaculum sp.]
MPNRNQRPTGPFTTGILPSSFRTVGHLRPDSLELGRDRAGIFQAQLMSVEDPGFEQEIADLVKKGVNVEAAVGETFTYYIAF